MNTSPNLKTVSRKIKYRSLKITDTIHNQNVDTNPQFVLFFFFCEHISYAHLNTQGVHMFKNFTAGHKIQIFMLSFMIKNDIML